MTESNGNGNGRQRFSVGQWWAIGVSAAALLGTVGSAYSNIQSELNKNREAIETLKREQSRTDASISALRDRASAADEEIRGSIRLLVGKLLDRDKQ